MDKFGAAQAERYQHELFNCFRLLAEFPGMAGPPRSVKGRDVYRFPFGSHVVIFTKTGAGVRIARLFHERIDWLRRLRREGYGA